MRVRVLAFARLRELLGFGSRDVDVPEGTTPDALWHTLAGASRDLHSLRGSTRFARNGTLADALSPLAEGDELALLPPVGGG
jgi:molybdopterin converting factor small subunit